MMEIQQRLARCFLLAFPDLRESEAYSASTSSLGSWDSMSMLVLTTVIEEEFHVHVEYEATDNCMDRVRKPSSG